MDDVECEVCGCLTNYDNVICCDQCARRYGTCCAADTEVDKCKDCAE